MVAIEMIARRDRSKPQRKRGIALVAGRFLALREHAGWTQRDVSEMTGVDVRTVGRWERDEANIGEATWELLCAKARVLRKDGDWRLPPS